MTRFTALNPDLEPVELMGVDAVTYWVRVDDEAEAAEHPGSSIGDFVPCEVHRPLHYLHAWSDDELERFRVTKLAPTLTELRAQALADAATEFDTRRQTPMAWNFGTIATLDDDDASQGPAGNQTLQMRATGENDDQKNWLAAQAGATIAVMGGVPTTVLPLKTTANVWVQTTAAQVLQVLVTGDGTQVSALQRGVLMLQAYGRLKKAIAEAADAAALEAIDLTEGWPD